ncbi:polysaccharide biosynthesis/export family protein [Burkholderia gladioli]|uniref:polysaccharide biosynthesis/export family protein n=1 Tax=Burkholderia gladioli TaxID=28095 RepID=UPI00163E5B0F|nr:polysaccharide biosynthesis/export family protein [Burkholderia gladioli]MDN7741637.1 polysaccharide biosynthesis/export family protein [Burkholderia gladioli]
MRHKDSIFALLAGWVVAGCAYAPGPALDASRMQEAPKDGAPAPTYAVHPIDANVISGQLRATAEAMPLPPQSAGQPHDDYRVGRGDILGITVWGHPELSVGAAATAPLPQLDGMAALGNGAGAPGSPGVLITPDGSRVAADGTIYFPTVGRVEVAGKTAAQISAMLVSRLGGYAIKPQLEVRVIQFRSQQVQLAGEVKNPGSLPITDLKLSVLDAITRSGGSLADADLQRVQLTRGGQTYVLDLQRTLDRGDVSQNVALETGDIVYVPDHNASRVFMLGEVAKPQTLFMDKGRMTLADAIATANGINPQSAQPRQILVIRRSAADPARPSIYRLDMTQVDSILLSTQFDLKPLDVVYVGTAQIAQVNRLLEQLLPTVTSMYLFYAATR